MQKFFYLKTFFNRKKNAPSKLFHQMWAQECQKWFIRVANGKIIYETMCHYEMFEFSICMSMQAASLICTLKNKLLLQFNAMNAIWYFLRLCKPEHKHYTANIFKVIFTVSNCVRLSTVVSLYGLHYCSKYNKIIVNWFTVFFNVIFTLDCIW